MDKADEVVDDESDLSSDTSSDSDEDLDEGEEEEEEEEESSEEDNEYSDDDSFVTSEEEEERQPAVHVLTSEDYVPLGEPEEDPVAILTGEVEEAEANQPAPLVRCHGGIDSPLDEDQECGAE
jgi:hypothetical protein